MNDTKSLASHPWGWLVVLLMAIQSVPPAWGQHTDVRLSLDEGAITVSPRAESGSFEEFFGSFFTTLPGLRAADGTFQEGDQFGVNIVERLLHWDGFKVSAPLHGETITLSTGPFSVEISGDQEFAEGFIFGTVGSQGGIHEDLSWTLLPGDEPEPTGGMYGIVMEVFSPAYASSEPFLFAQGHFDEEFSTLEQFDEGFAYLQAYVFPLEGDVNRDGFVRLDDFTILKEHFGESGVEREQGDLSGDGAVNLTDFTLLKSDFGATHPEIAALGTAAVPEPSTAWLGLCGIFCARLVKKQRRRQALTGRLRPNVDRRFLSHFSSGGRASCENFF